ncbi:hypothetical protein OBBRIDRAFT_769863 [Obba rivulosa]|uniref:C2 domain-containing protein n=1 Tax=Obba rivulosa TaxID=1052685 RepID=A0A8E2DRQ4_9APHY|nr:hypothetical protein OBBRIDRAFT_769863 [Obba rivulosa]
MSDELGTLVVVVLKAKNLHDKHSLYKQDVFAQISLNDQAQKTGVDVRGGQHPVWDQELRLSISRNGSDKYRTLEVSCWSKEPRSEEIIGKGKVDITETLHSGEFDDWVPLELNGAYRGELYLEMTFFAAGPPPLQRRVSKFSPRDRLARPAQPYLYPPVNHGSPKTPPKTPPKSPQTLPVRSRPNSASHDPLTFAPTPTPPKTPPKSPQTLPVRSRPNSASYDPLTFAPAPTSPTGTYIAPGPTSRHSPPRDRDSPLPPIPEAHLNTVSIPAILRPGNPTSPPHVSHASLAPEHPLHARAPRAPSQSPPRAVPALPTHPRPGASIEYTPPSLRPGPPREGRPYPYNYPLVPPEPELPVSYVTAPAVASPLPDEPHGVHTPTPANPYPYVPPPKPSPRHRAPGHAKMRSREEHNQLLALALEREEEERHRRAAEQEERDRELARKLDLELNLEPEEGPEASTESRPPPARAMPGGW